MQDKYLRFECPNCPSESRRQMECRRLLGGVSVKFIEVYGFTVPYEDVRYCPACSMFWKITIKSLKHPIKYEKIDGSMDFIKLNNLIHINGRKVKRP